MLSFKPPRIDRILFSWRAAICFIRSRLLSDKLDSETTCLNGFNQDMILSWLLELSYSSLDGTAAVVSSKSSSVSPSLAANVWQGEIVMMLLEGVCREDIEDDATLWSSLVWWEVVHTDELAPSSTNNSWSRSRRRFSVRHNSTAFSAIAISVASLVSTNSRSILVITSNLVSQDDRTFMLALGFALRNWCPSKKRLLVVINHGTDRPFKVLSWHDQELSKLC